MGVRKKISVSLGVRACAVLDDELRMHTTDSGNWFIQTRIP